MNYVKMEKYFIVLILGILLCISVTATLYIEDDFSDNSSLESGNLSCTAGAVPTFNGATLAIDTTGDWKGCEYLLGENISTNGATVFIREKWTVQASHTYAFWMCSNTNNYFVNGCNPYLGLGTYGPGANWAHFPGSWTQFHASSANTFYNHSYNITVFDGASTVHDSYLNNVRTVTGGSLIGAGSIPAINKLHLQGYSNSDFEIDYICIADSWEECFAEEPVVDPCVYVSGNYELNYSNNCLINTTDIGANDIIIVGDFGFIAFNGTITFKDIIRTPDDLDGDSAFIKYNGTRFNQVK